MIGVGEPLVPVAADLGDGVAADAAQQDAAAVVARRGGDVVVAFVGQELFDHGGEQLLVLEFLDDQDVGVERFDGTREVADQVARFHAGVFVVGVGVVPDVEEVFDVVGADGDGVWGVGPFGGELGVGGRRDGGDQGEGGGDQKRDRHPTRVRARRERGAREGVARAVSAAALVGPEAELVEGKQAVVVVADLVLVLVKQPVDDRLLQP